MKTGIGNFLRALSSLCLVLVAAAAAAEPAYTVTSEPAELLRLPEPRLPDVSGYTRAAIEAKIDTRRRATVSVRKMLGHPAMQQFIGSDNNLAEWVRRQHGMPQAIFIEGGYINLADLAKKLAGTPYWRKTESGAHLARLPIVVAHGATLHIGEETRELRLSQERGAFLVNDGRLFIVGSRVTAWREADNSPARFRRPAEFRPFLIFWGGTETYIADSVITSFGYDKSKSYGISISQYPPGQIRAMKREEPSGWIVGAEFIDMWYGFYCYETRGFVIKDSIYRDNIVYGIDPHDRSRGLIIAGNTARGTKKKHGIIVSREVNDSFIFNNISHGNRLSGIVVDRSSTNNLLAGNEVRGNQSDGITIYESANNLLWGNRAIGNARHGIRVRNSENVRLYENFVADNGMYGIYGHMKDLSGSGRDIALDPFETKMSLTVVGGKIGDNGSGPISIEAPFKAELYRIDIRMPGKEINPFSGGVFSTHMAEILDLLVRQRKAVLVTPREENGGVRQ
ncbi:MAG: mannuronan 5-epimerase AlgG [Azoarcus sp.]|jgi:poly(beta-D-mannuronate) C5 epimerase|nr:mannuronan 5-epimerase AlgG [Azoarcus sp.]